jgi:hypothetical protein
METSITASTPVAASKEIPANLTLSWVLPWGSRCRKRAVAPALPAPLSLTGT